MPHPMTPRPEGETMKPCDCLHCRELLALGAAPRYPDVPAPIPAASGGTEPTYACDKCGKQRTRAEGGTVFTVCDECWDGTPPASAPGSGEVGEEDRAWLNCELLRFLNCYKSPTPGSLADMALVQGQKEGALRYFFEAVCNRFAERSAAVRRAAEQGYQDGVNKWMPIAERAAKQEREGFVKALLAIGIEPTEDDDGRWYVAAEPDGQDFDTLKEALIFAFNLRDADREQRAAEQGRRGALDLAWEEWVHNEYGAGTERERAEYIAKSLAALRGGDDGIR